MNLEHKLKGDQNYEIVSEALVDKYFRDIPTLESKVEKLDTRTAEMTADLEHYESNESIICFHECLSDCIKEGIEDVRHEDNNE